MQDLNLWFYHYSKII